MRFDDEKVSWDTLLELIRSKKRQRVFWDFVEQLRNTRLNFNQILMSKYRNLPRNLKKHEKIKKLFSDRATPVEDPYISNQSQVEKPPLKSESSVQWKGDFSQAEQNIAEDFFKKVSAITGKRGESDLATSGRRKDSNTLRPQASVEYASQGSRKSSRRASKIASSNDIFQLCRAESAEQVDDAGMRRTENSQQERAAYNKMAVTKQFRRRGITLDPQSITNSFKRLVKEDLIPNYMAKGTRIRKAYMNEFLSTVFDNYSSEYGQFFHDEVVVFEE